MSNFARSVAVAAIAAGGFLAAALAQAPAAAAEEVITLDLSGPRPIAMLAIGDEPPVPVVFDTGASGNVIDVELARSLHLPELGPALVSSPAGGTPVEGFLTRLAEARLGGTQLHDVRAVALPLPVPNARGVFGPNSFAGRLVRIDFAAARVRILDKSPTTIPAGTSYPYSEGPRPLPGVPVEIGGVSYDGHLDSGSNGTLTFPRRLAEALPLDGPLHPVGQARLAGGEPVQILGARLRGTVRVGPVELQDPEVAFIEGLPRVNVGMGVLRGVTLVLDPAERRSWLLPN